MKKSSPKSLSADCWFSLGRQLADSIPTAHRKLTDSKPTLQKKHGNYRCTLDYLSVWIDCRCWSIKDNYFQFVYFWLLIYLSETIKAAYNLVIDFSFIWWFLKEQFFWIKLCNMLLWFDEIILKCSTILYSLTKTTQTRPRVFSVHCSIIWEFWVSFFFSRIAKFFQIWSTVAGYD